MITLLIYTLLIILVFGVIAWAIGKIPLPEPWMRSVALAVVGLICLLVIINLWLPFPYLYSPRRPLP